MARGDLNASQLLGGQQRGAATSDRDVETIIVRVLASKFGLSERLLQELQALAGQRYEPGDSSRPKAAVRRGDLSPIGRMQAFSSKEVTGTVTAADYNALRQDMRRVYEALSLVVLALQSN